MKPRKKKIDSDRVCIGGRMYDALAPRHLYNGKINLGSKLSYDRERKVIQIKEADLVQLLRLADPYGSYNKVEVI